MSNIWLALLMTLIAGMATAIGSLMAFCTTKTNFRFLSISTGFSAGVMLYVSFVEIFAKGHEALTETYGLITGEWYNNLAFFAGILFIGIIDAIIPHDENPHEIHAASELSVLHKNGQKPVPVPNHSTHHLMRSGLFTALAIAIHNFPEGLATFMSALNDPQLGLAITVAIALHNIPEGISVSIPIFYATGNRKKALFYSILSGLAEPLGALIALGLLMVTSGDGELAVSNSLLGFSFAFIAGIMVYISLDELLPASRTYGKGHDSLIGLLSGMAVMALSLILMR